MLTERSGLSIIAGATGHGKSTVLKNIMESLIEQNPTKNYMTMEDPPEFAIRSAKQRVIVTKSNSENERKLQLVSANASLLRSEPDVLMIGEIRYLEMPLHYKGKRGSLHAPHGQNVAVLRVFK